MTKIIIVFVTLYAVQGVFACQWGWKRFHGNCYKPSLRQLNYKDANRECENMGAILAQPMNKVENFVLGYFVRYTTTWIGVNDINKEGRWVLTQNGKQIAKYTNWGRYLPDNRNDEDCGAIDFRGSQPGKWNDYHCSIRFRFICQIKA